MEAGMAKINENSDVIKRLLKDKQQIYENYILKLDDYSNMDDYKQQLMNLEEIESINNEFK
jgi:hypothetical protein